MSGTSNSQAYPNTAWQNSPGQNSPPGPNAPWNRPWGDGNGNGNGAWNGPPSWYHGGIGKPIAIAAIVFLLAAGHLGRILFWPLGLAFLVYMVASGRFGCGGRRWRQGWGQPSDGNNAQGNNGQGNGNTWQSCAPWGRWWNAGGGNGGGNQQQPPSSGNHAFDEYRAETLRRLEEEQKDFSSFLERLRFAKDKAEFDQFMSDRRRNPPAPTAPPAPEQPPAA